MVIQMMPKRDQTSVFGTLEPFHNPLQQTPFDEEFLEGGATVVASLLIRRKAPFSRLARADDGGGLYITA